MGLDSLAMLETVGQKLGGEESISQGGGEPTPASTSASGEKVDLGIHDNGFPGRDEMVVDTPAKRDPEEATTSVVGDASTDAAAGPTATSPRRLQEALKCSVCLELLATAAGFQCGHVSCFLCAHRWLTKVGIHMYMFTMCVCVYVYLSTYLMCMRVCKSVYISVYMCAVFAVRLEHELIA